MFRRFTLALAAAMLVISAVQAQSLRLAAMHRTYFLTSWNPFDSATFVYSNGRGGEGADFESRKLKHDTAYFQAYNGSGWQPYYIEVQSFDNNNRITQRLKMNWSTSSNTYVNTEKTTFLYDANNNVLETTDANWSTSTNSWVNAARVTRTYDANSNMLTYLYETWTNNAWRNSNSTVYGYTANNDMLYNKNMVWNTTTNQWDSTNYWQYYYTNNLQDSIRIFSWSGGAWQLDSRFHLGYDVNNQPNFMLYQQWSGSNWTNISQRFTRYAPQYSEDSSQTWNTTTNSWENSDFYSFDLNAANKPLRYLLKKWDVASGAWKNELVDSTTYNSQGLKTSYKRLSWMETTQTWGGKSYDNIVRYWYESYVNGVKSMQTNHTDLQLYPVPAGNTLHVAAQFETPQDFRIAIYDMQGRILKQWSGNATTSYHQSLPIADLPAGNYILQVKSRNGNAQQQFTIAK